MTAADLARRLGLSGCRETQRRRVRAMVHALREDDGRWILADLTGGYWLTADRQQWLGRYEHRMIDGKRLIAEAASRKKMITDAAGQGLLFVPDAAKQTTT